MRLTACLLPLLGLPLACSAAAPTAAPERDAVAAIPVAVPGVVARYPHDDAAFTEGLLWHGGALYESTGQVGRSEIRQVRLSDGKVLRRTPYPAGTFGEGLALWKDDLLGLSWRAGTGWRWDRATFRRKGSFRYTGEGWGLTGDGHRLIQSDGSDELRFRDPLTYAEQGRLRVTAGGRPVRNLNELEWVDGEILANIWQTAFIARIDPATGHVTGWLDLRSIAGSVAVADPDAVLNGIAYDAKDRRLFVTGKYWPALFEIRIPPKAR